jgi:hypothetical protein
VWSSIRTSSGIFKGKPLNDIKELYWGTDHNHVRQLGHNQLADILAHMVRYESSPERSEMALEDDISPDEWEPAEEVKFAEYTDLRVPSKNTITAPSEVIKKQGEYVYFATCISNMALPDKEYLLPESMQGKGLTAGQGKFMPVSNDDAWDYVDERGGKMGWIANDKVGGASITFPVVVPKDVQGTKLVVRLGFLRSYAHMGKFSVTVADKAGHQGTTVVDGLWEKHLSIYQEADVFDGITGDATVTITTMSAKDMGREENKIKILAVIAMRSIS